MKAVLNSAANPVFTPGAANAGTLNFSTAVASYGFQFGRLLGIVNLTSNAIIYTAGVSGFGGSWNNGTNVLTLAQSTSGMAAGDTLEVIWDDPNASITVAPPTISQGWPNSLRYVAVAGTPSVSVKSSAGVVGAIYINSPANSVAGAYVKFYDSATAVTAGTAGVKLTFSVGSGNGAANVSPAPTIFAPVAGIKFNNGIQFTITGAMPDADVTAIGANTCVVNVLYV